MNLHEFRIARDEMQLASIQARKSDLEARYQSLTADVNDLINQLAQYPAPAAGLQYHLNHDEFDERMRIINIREKLLSALDDKQRAWAVVEADLANIDHAVPVIEARLAANRAGVSNVVSIVDGFMGALGFKKASGE